MTALATFTTAELAAEMERRAAEVREAAAVARRARFMKLLANKALLLTLFPEHGRTSCSDTNVANGFYTRSDCGPRCTRCALLEMDEHNADDFEVDLLLSFNHVTANKSMT